MSPRNKFTLFKVSDDHKKTKQQQQIVSQLNTESLDVAIEDFRDVCQQYNKKAPLFRPEEDGDKQEPPRPIRKEDFSSKMAIGTPDITTKSTLANNHCDKTATSNSNFKTPYQSQSANNNNNNNNNSDFDESIDRLQCRQTDLQTQLDEVLRIAEELTSKQRRKFKSILEDETATSRITTEENEDDELIEFQQIENELRISELNRQLSNIQEELRIRLYKRLTNNTENGNGASNGIKHIARCNSQEDEISPSSSSCSDGPQNTSFSSILAEVHHSNNQLPPTTSANYAPSNTKQLDEHDGITMSKDTSSFRHFKQNFTNFVDTTVSTNSSCANTTVLERNLQATNPTRADNKDNNPTTSSELDNLMESLISEYESLTLESKKDENLASRQVASHQQNNLDSMTTSCRNNLAASHQIQESDYQVPIANGVRTNNIYCNPTLACPGNGLPRCNAANSDLERIEEDGEEDEDEQDCYTDSNQMRSIYEEKFSSIAQQNIYPNSSPDILPIAQQTRLQAQQQQQDKNLYSYSEQKHYDGISQVTSDALATRLNGGLQVAPNGNSNNRKFSLSNVNTTKRTPASKTKPNRPLTLYLPKPDEEIDLVEHIQTLGHDLNTVTDDLKIDTTSAHGYLWKCCSNNSKKWLKRYFHFDRNSKILSYFDTESHLVKKNAKPKNSIPFDEISDVYVDHRLSGKDDRRRSSSASSRKFVFVLSTIKRKYFLATNRAETMRIWIDVLFTAAKSNDFFQQFDDEDQNDLTGEGDNDISLNRTLQTIELNSQNGCISLPGEK